MATHNDFGRAAEQLAAELLQRRGWTVLHRNWRFRRREVDLIVRRKATVAFVEVRARGSIVYGHPLSTIDGRKRHGLESAARAWIAQYGRSGEEYRFDVVTIVGECGAAPIVEYMTDAWRLQ
jgi:putative endonuclease